MTNDNRVQHTWESLWEGWNEKQREQAGALNKIKPRWAKVAFLNTNGVFCFCSGLVTRRGYGWEVPPASTVKSVCQIELTAFPYWWESLIVFPEPEPDYQAMVDKLGWFWFSGSDKRKILGMLDSVTEDGFFWAKFGDVGGDCFRPLTKEEALALVYEPE